MEAPVPISPTVFRRTDILSQEVTQQREKRPAGPRQSRRPCIEAFVRFRVAGAASF